MVKTNMIPFNVILRGVRIATVLHAIPEGMKNAESRAKVKKDLIAQGYEPDISVHQKRPDGTRFRGPSRKTLERQGKFIPQTAAAPQAAPQVVQEQAPAKTAPAHKPGMEVPPPVLPSRPAAAPKITSEVTEESLNRAMSNFVKLFGGEFPLAANPSQKRQTYTGPERRTEDGTRHNGNQDG